MAKSVCGTPRKTTNWVNMIDLGLWYEYECLLDSIPGSQYANYFSFRHISFGTQRAVRGVVFVTCRLLGFARILSALGISNFALHFASSPDDMEGRRLARPITGDLKNDNSHI